MVIDQARIALADPRRLGPLAYRIINLVQDVRPEDQAAAIALSFKALCDALKIHPGDVLQAATNILNGNQKFYPEVAALRGYLKDVVAGGMHWEHADT